MTCRSGARVPSLPSLRASPAALSRDHDDLRGLGFRFQPQWPPARMSPAAADVWSSLNYRSGTNVRPWVAPVGRTRRLVVTLATQYLKGDDRAGLLGTIRRSRTGPGLPLSLRGPLFTLSRAYLSPQPPADVRICRDVVLLHRCWSARRDGGGGATCTLAGRPQAADSNPRRSRSGNCLQRGRSAISGEALRRGAASTARGSSTGRTAGSASHFHTVPTRCMTRAGASHVRGCGPATCSSSPGSGTSGSTSGAGEWCTRLTQAPSCRWCSWEARHMDPGSSASGAYASAERLSTGD